MNPSRFPNWLYAPISFAILTLAMFFDVLFTAQHVLSAPSTDTAMQFIPWREFGFSQLRQGNFPLWNPHVFGGAPYFAGFQSALLYPPNWLHLILPMATAINWVMALHVFLAGYFTYLWCRGRGVGIGGSIVAGIMFMFGGPYFLHLYAGHLPHLAVMVWTPLMLLTIDKLAETGAWRWCILGIAAAAMHILAGHPQYVYYTGIVLSIYAAMRMIDTRHRLTLAGGFVAMYVGAVMLTAVQLIAGIQAASEQVRSTGLKYEMAATFSLPPVNLITLLVPTFFGNVSLRVPDASFPTTEAELAAMYWGAGYLWEFSLFLSIGGLILAILGAIRGDRRAIILAVVMLGITFIFALGRHTPLYGLMYKLLPAYGSFRGTVKFAYLCSLFVALLAGMGFDALLRDRRVPMPYLYGVGMLALALMTLGTIVWGIASQGPDGAWIRFVTETRSSALKAEELFIRPFDVQIQQKSGEYAAVYTFVASAVVFGLGVLLWACRFHRWVPYLLVLAISIEMFVFARSTRATFDPAFAIALPQPWIEALKDYPRDQRVVTSLTYANRGMSVGYNNLNGFDPALFKRYAELIYFSQGQNPDEASQYLFTNNTRWVTNILRMLRCGLIFHSEVQSPAQIPSPLPVAVVASNVVQLDSRDAILNFLASSSFSPVHTVVLESPPGIDIEPGAGVAGTVRVVSQTTDTVELQAEMDRPGILVITNNYSTGWRIRPIESAQSGYRIMPANYTQIGIPLQKGKHRLLLEYSPAAFRVGIWVSVFSLLGYVAGSILLMRKRL